ncbi:MAG: hypothetical protein OXH52_07120 [Gammaproteobacteria bacterium]|nr:hypothetical protein [Gammaproteobacteria bacterium]
MTARHGWCSNWRPSTWRGTPWGPISLVSRLGPDHAGRYELLFAALRGALDGCRERIESLLALSDPASQVARVAPRAELGQHIDRALDDVMRTSNLV